MLYRGHHDHERFEISLTKHSSTLVLSPLQKRVQQKKKTKSVADKKSLQATKVIDLQTYEQQKKLSKAVEQKVEKKEATPKPGIKKQEQPVQVEKKEVKVSGGKRSGIKLAGAKPKKDLKKLIEEKPKKVETVPVQNEKPDIDKQQKIKEERLEKVVQQEEQRNDLDLENVEFVGYEQLDSIALQHKIQDNIAKLFKPPVGIAKDVICELSVQVDQQGKAQAAKVVKSSGILAYDTAARGAIYKAEFPKEIYRKTITIALGQ